MPMKFLKNLGKFLVSLCYWYGFPTLLFNLIRPLVISDDIALYATMGIWIAVTTIIVIVYVNHSSSVSKRT